MHHGGALSRSAHRQAYLPDFLFQLRILLDVLRHGPGNSPRRWRPMNSSARHTISKSDGVVMASSSSNLQLLESRNAARETRAAALIALKYRLPAPAFHDRPSVCPISLMLSCSKCLSALRGRRDRSIAFEVSCTRIRVSALAAAWDRSSTGPEAGLPAKPSRPQVVPPDAARLRSRRRACEFDAAGEFPSVFSPVMCRNQRQRPRLSAVLAQPPRHVRSSSAGHRNHQRDLAAG